LQGAGELGLDLPDIIDAGRPFAIGITGADRTYDVSCRVTDLATGRQAR
jgi:hypothetical protein